MVSGIITRCPECGTSFRASAAQLAARDGKVRCGRCGAVFDAPAYRVSGFSEALPARENIAAGPPEPQEAKSEAAPQPLEASSALAHSELVLTPSTPENGPSEALPQSKEAVLQDFADPNLELDFGQSHSGGRAMRLWLAIPAAGMLTLLLAGQVAFHFRGDLALLFPRSKAWFEQICARLDCSLPLPRRADMMSIESSDLQADPLNPGMMILSATLRNRAPFAQSPPALELTLTDAQDHALARRVLGVADYLRPVAGSAADDSTASENLFPPGSEVAIKLFFDASAVNATGYRLYLFYP